MSIVNRVISRIGELVASVNGLDLVITAEDIANGIRHDAGQCAGALAAKRLFPNAYQVWVYASRINVVREPGGVFEIWSGPGLREFILSYDGAKGYPPAQPTTIRIDRYTMTELNALIFGKTAPLISHQ